MFNTLGNQPYMTRRMPSTHWGRVNSLINMVSTAFSSLGNILIGRVVDRQGYVPAWQVVGMLGALTIVLVVALNLVDRRQFGLLYQKPESPTLEG